MSIYARSVIFGPAVFVASRRLGAFHSFALARICLPQQLRNTPDARRTLRGDQKPFDRPTPLGIYTPRPTGGSYTIGVSATTSAAPHRGADTATRPKPIFAVAPTTPPKRKNHIDAAAAAP